LSAVDWSLAIDKFENPQRLCEFVGPQKYPETRFIKVIVSSDLQGGLKLGPNTNSQIRY